MGLFGGSGVFFEGGGSPFGGSGIITDIDKPRTPKIPESVKEKMRKSDNPVVQLISTIDDAKEEAKELATDGFTEMVIKKNNDYRTSFEKREEAEKIINRAKSRYNKAVKRVNEEIKALNAHIQKNNEVKQSLCSLIKKKINQSDEIHTRLSGHLSTPEITFDNSVHLLIPIYEGSSIDDSAEIRKQAFDNYLEDAKDYKVQIASEIAGLDQTSGKIHYLETILSEEEQLLNALQNSLDMKRSDEYRKIYDTIHLLLATYIADQTGNPNSNYVKTLDELKRLV